jgi:hypothetical protein
MWNRIDITKVIDTLNKEQYSFYFTDGNLFLDDYKYLHKENNSKRKFEVIKHYSRIHNRNSNIEEKDVPLPESIKMQARELFYSQLFYSQLKVMKWSER